MASTPTLTLATHSSLASHGYMRRVFLRHVTLSMVQVEATMAAMLFAE
jgi:hypothetical protein